MMPSFFNYLTVWLSILIHSSQYSIARSFICNQPSRYSKVFYREQHNFKLQKPYLNQIPEISRNDPFLLNQQSDTKVCVVSNKTMQFTRRKIQSKKNMSAGFTVLLGLFLLRNQSSTLLALTSLTKIQRFRRLAIITIFSALSWLKLSNSRVTKNPILLNNSGQNGDKESITSRWYYYASHANARNRAFLLVLMKVGCKYLMENLRNCNHKHSGTCLTNGLLKLGPTYVKLGQILSSNSKVDSEWRTSLERLQDRVPATIGQEALELARQSYKIDHECNNNTNDRTFDSVFDSFDTTPLASASIGQVHLATLRSNNETVALKIQRPSLQEIYDQDSKTLLKMSKMVDKFRSLVKKNPNSTSWVDIFTSAQAILYKELNYTLEGEYGMRIAHDFGLYDTDDPKKKSSVRALDGKTPLSSAKDWIRIPRVYPQYSNSKVLVMEYVPSTKVTDAILNLTETQRSHLASSLARAYLRQFCLTKFFSTDPHPGNVGVEFLPNEKVRLVLYDFGQACFLSQNQSEGILEVMEGIMDFDAEKCVKAFSKMGVLQQNADCDKILQKVQNNFDTGKVAVKKKKTNQSQKITKNDPSLSKTPVTFNKTRTSKQQQQQQVQSYEIESSVKDSEIMSYFTLPAEYAFVARAISQMDGVGKCLDPEFDFVSTSAPFLVEIKGTEMYLKDFIFKNFILPVTQRQTKFYKKIFGYTLPQQTVNKNKDK